MVGAIRGSGGLEASSSADLWGGLECRWDLRGGCRADGVCGGIWGAVRVHGMVGGVQEGLVLSGGLIR